MATTPVSGYFNRFDPSKNYEKHLFRAGYVLQSAEVNEIQEYASNGLQMMGDALFKDGDVIRDARVTLDPQTGIVTCESGAVYLRGKVRGVPPGQVTVPMTGSVAVGIYLEETTVTENEDPTLRDPAADTRNYQEPGASRLRVEPRWGIPNDGQQGNFFPVYFVVDGNLQAKDPPPQMDAVSQAIARYDRDSTESNYIVAGMRVTQLEDLPSGHQVYNVADGRARVNGFGVTLPSSRRVNYPAQPELRHIDSEPHTSSTVNAQRVTLDRTPVNEITQVRITAQKQVTLNHGTFVGAQDPLPDTSVVDIVEVRQGATVYVKNVDYRLTSGRVDWSLSGAEPATGSSYQVTYQYITSVTPTAVDDEGYTVTGAVVGTLILTNYSVKLPRVDRLCIDENGAFVWVQGVSTDFDPVRPNVPTNLISLAQVLQTWDDGRRVINDGTRVVPMYEIEGMQARMDVLTDLVAQQKLVSDLGVREASAKKGLFVDPFLDDEQRDQGLSQTAAVFDGILTLAIDGQALTPSNDITAPALCAYTLEPLVSQTQITGAMKINPYMAFGILPAQATLNPPVDRWTEVVTTWKSAVTKRFTTGSGGAWGTVVGESTSTTKSVLVKTTTQPIETLRQITVAFQLAGFGPGETLTSVTFDGLPVTPVAA